MRRTFFAAAAAAAFAVGLAGCTTSGSLGTIGGAISAVAGASLTREEVYGIDAAYQVGAQTWIKGYIRNYDTTPCARGEHTSLAHICSEYDVVVRLQGIDASVGQALDNLEAGFEACARARDPKATSCSGLANLFNLATRAIADGKTVAASFGYGG